MLKPHHVLVTGNLSAKNSTRGGIFRIVSVIILLFVDLGAKKFFIQVQLMESTLWCKLPSIAALYITTTREHTQLFF